ncbi:tetratricopeptide repeat protein [Tautonia sociabilis]|uniref:Tetratricopeptide repeat protein n=1 Tax=Tautonia sociabilis TaxID=2080755 RepID=A0A432MHC6_9BACT|nr:tetratricopeptide repeat protein [Tautonia sociabilis]RUL86194.1 tetratricopeptide repeat protein [Tautonia sociabilis]
MSEPLSRIRIFRAEAVAAAMLAMILLTAGCQAGPPPSAGGSFAVLPMMSRKGTAGGPEESRSLLSRWVGTPSPKEDGDLHPASGLILGPDGWAEKDESMQDRRAAEFEAAEQLYLQGDFDAAERAFARIARRERRPKINLLSDPVGSVPSLEQYDPSRSPWGMKALYYLGEIRFRQGNYVKAHDTFEELLKQYPGTPHLDEAVAREFEIAQIWLNQVRPSEDRPPLPWHSRFKGSLPLIDSGGHAVAVLEHVRQNDPTGPLADDAVKLIADHYAASGDFENAAFYYDQLVNDHPKSPLLHDALLASVDSKLNAYIGPEYDFSGLAEARETVRRTMQLFPERRASTTDEKGDDLYRKLDLIADQEAERAYSYGEYFRSAGYVISAEYYFGMITQKWPRSPWAEKAKQQLAELATMPRKESAPLKTMTQPGASDPFSQGISSGNLGSLGPGGSVGP